MPLAPISFREQLLIKSGPEFWRYCQKHFPGMILRQVPAKWGNYLIWQAELNGKVGEGYGKYEAARNCALLLIGQD